MNLFKSLYIDSKIILIKFLTIHTDYDKIRVKIL